MGDTNRKQAHGCIVFRITEQDDITSPKTRKRIIDLVNDVLRKHGPKVKILVWVSIPCTGGSPWQRVNKYIPSAAVKIEGHVHEMKRIWSGMVDLVNSLRRLSPWIAIEWPDGCDYWELDKVKQFCVSHVMDSVRFDGCMVGVVDMNNVPIRKPWRIQTNLSQLIDAFVGKKCQGGHEHAEGRGASLKRTEEYTYSMTDLIHQAFRVAVSAQ